MMPLVQGASTAPASLSETPPDHREVQEWVFTTDSSSGAVVKIERLDMGQRFPLTEIEYASIASVYPAILSGDGSFSTAEGSENAAKAEAAAEGLEPTGSEADDGVKTEQGLQITDPYGYLQAYYSGVADYATLLASFFGDRVK